MEHNDIDFRKAVRLIEEARDRLDEASEILGAFNTGDRAVGTPSRTRPGPLTGTSPT